MCHGCIVCKLVVQSTICMSIVLAPRTLQRLLHGLRRLMAPMTQERWKKRFSGTFGVQRVQLLGVHSSRVLHHYRMSRLYAEHQRLEREAVLLSSRRKLVGRKLHTRCN